MFPVSLRNYPFEEWNLTFVLAAGITAADIGKAVALDTSADNTVKLAGADDEIFGRLEQVEDRKQEGTLIGAVALKFGAKLPIATGETVAVGDSLVGAGAGEVKAALSPNRLKVVQIDGTDAIALAL